MQRFARTEGERSECEMKREGKMLGNIMESLKSPDRDEEEGRDLVRIDGELVEGWRPVNGSPLPSSPRDLRN